MTKTRTPKTPRQRAEEALGVATRKVKRLTERKTALEKELREIETELVDETKRYEHAKTSPDLPTRPGEPDTSPSSGTTRPRPRRVADNPQA